MLALVVLHLPPDVVLALTLGGILFMVIALRPYVGVQMFLFLLLFENVLEAREGLTPMKTLGAVILGGWLLNLMTRRQSRLRGTLALLALISFVIWNGICVVYAIDVESALMRLFSYVQLALAALMFASVVSTPARLRGVMGALVIWTCLVTLLAIVQYYLGETPTAVGPVGNRNLLALYINVAIVCAYMLHQVTPNGARRVALLAALPLLFLGLALTFSRSGLIGMVATLLLVLWRMARRRSVMVLLGSAALLCAITFVIPAEFYVRARTIVPAIQRREDTFGTRVRLWRVAGRMAQDRPIFGVGPGNFIPAYPRYARGGEMLTRNYATHNAYLGILAESGGPGLLLFLTLGLAVLAEAQRTIRAAHKSGLAELELLAAAVEVSAIAVLIGGLSGNAESLKLLWMAMGLGIGLTRLREAGVPRHSAPLVSPIHLSTGGDAAISPATLPAGRG
jgi:O-antigen ligase